MRGLQVSGRVGVTDAERLSPQGLVIDAELEIDLAPAQASDDVSDTVDYGAVVAGISEIVERKRARLLEHLAGEIASHLLRYEGVTSVIVEVAKSDPPIEQQADAVGVRIRRTR